MEQVYTVATARFEAACKIESLALSHRASRLHGHGFQISVRAALEPKWASAKGNEVADLGAHLQAVITPLDHQYLNDIIANPTNENIARWIGERLSIKFNKIAIQSTPTEGVDLDQSGEAHVWQQFSFEAAHQLPNVSPGHQCGRMHGHGFKVILHAHQPIGDAPMAVDLDQLATLWSTVAPELEFACLNNIKGLENPTSENLCAWVWARLKPRQALLSHISVYETATAGCHYDGAQFQIWKDFTFESALSVSKKSDEQYRHLFGHSYLTRLHIHAPLDAKFGWTIDYGEIKARFKPLLECLDHHLLNEIEGLETASSAQLASWIRAKLLPDLAELKRVDCYEKTGCGAVVFWADETPALPV